MTSPRPVPIFDGHNDVLLRLYRRGGTDVSRAFLEGEAKGQLDLPLARQGGFVGGLFAIFVPSSDGQNGPNDETASQRVSSGALSAPAVELAPAQRAVLSMVSLLLRIERESKGRVRICRNVTDIQQALKDDVLAPVLTRMQSTRISSSWTYCMRRDFALSGRFGADPMRSGMACRSVVPHRPTRVLV